MARKLTEEGMIKKDVEVKTPEGTTFRIYGNPVAQGRPRFYRAGNRVGVYDPDKSKSWKNNVISQTIDRKPEFYKGAIHMTLHFLMPRPKSLPKKVIHHIKRPDLDNLAKSIKDALTGICFKDDSQIVSLMVTKKYVLNQTGVLITIKDEGI